MSEECPNCSRGAIGSQIVELDHASGELTTMAVVCAGCNVVYASKKAREQMEEIHE